MLRTLYNWTISLAAHPHAMWYLGLISFIESAFFPIPPDVLLIPIMLAAPARAWLAATVCTVASILGGIAGYAIGYFVFETVGRPLIDFYGAAAQFAAFQHSFNDYGGWVVALFGFTPFPYKVITVASGVVQLDFLTFILASVISRGARFYLEAYLLLRYGPPIRDFIEKRLGLLTLIAFACLFGGFLAIEYL